MAPVGSAAAIHDTLHVCIYTDAARPWAVGFADAPCHGSHVQLLQEALEDMGQRDLGEGHMVHAQARSTSPR